MTEASGASGVDLLKTAGMMVEAGDVVVMFGLTDVSNVLAGVLLVLLILLMLLMLLGVVVVLLLEVVC